MVLPQRQTQPKWIVCSNDLALQTVDDDVLRTYLLSRNLDDLYIDVKTGVCKKNQEQVSLFQVLPLKSDYTYLLDTLSADALKKIFKHHVIEAKNVDGWVPPVADGRGIKDAVIDGLPITVISEVATVCVELANGKDGAELGFTLPGTWLQERMRSRQLPAVRAKLDNVSKLILKSDEEATPSVE